MNEIITKLTDHIIVAILIGAGSALFFNRKLLYRRILIYYYRKKECRISFACLLAIRHDDRYLLIRNFNRPETFGPIGGVYKYYDTAKSFLDSVQYRQQHTVKAREHNDLRGFIPINNLNKMIKWFDKGIDREVESVSREFREEIIEDLKLTNPFLKKGVPKFRFLKKIIEEPHQIEGRDYIQYYRMDLYELLPTDIYNIELTKYLIKESKRNNNIELVTVDEIKKRRTTISKNIIGSYCGFLFSNKRIGNVDVHYD